MCAAQMSCSLEPKKYDNTYNKCQGYVVIAFAIFLFIVFRLFAFFFSSSIILSVFYFIYFISFYCIFNRQAALFVLYCVYFCCVLLFA